MTDNRPVLIVFGNCQAEIAHACVKSLAAVSSRFQVEYVRSFVHPTEGRQIVSADLVERCSILWEQFGSWGGFPDRQRLATTVQTKRFTSLDFPVLWPLHYVDTRNKGNSDDPYGPYPYGDRVGARLAGQGLSTTDAIMQYHEQSAKEIRNLDRLLAITVARLRQVDVVNDIALGQYVLDHFRQERLFWTYNHPTAKLLGALSRMLIEATDFGAGCPEPKDVAHAVEWLDLGIMEPLGSHHVPIHPLVAKHFGLSWWRPDLSYKHLDFGEFTLDQYMARYIQWQT